jgi:hypothetical protein
LATPEQRKGGYDRGSSLNHHRPVVEAGATLDQISSAVSRHWRISLRSIRASPRTLRLRIPCRRAFLALATLPRSVFGPHDRSHGFQLRMSAACRARRSDVQPLLMA